MSWLYRGVKSITPKSVDWKYCGMHILNLSEQNNHEIIFNDFEGVLLSLSAENVSVVVDGVEFKWTVVKVKWCATRIAIGNVDGSSNAGIIGG